MKQLTITKEEILSTFIELFNLYGSSLTLNQLSSSLHISKKTIYKFFTSKNEIYEAILDSAIEQISKRQKEIYENPSLSLNEKIHQLLTIETEEEKKLNMERVRNLSESDPKFFRRLMDEYEVRWDYFSKLLQEGINEGIIKQDTNINLVIRVLEVSLQSFYRKDFQKFTELNYTEAVKKLVNTILEGIKV